MKALATAAAPRLFESHCAREAYAERSADPAKLKVKELKAELKAQGFPTTGKKAELVSRLLVARRTAAVFGPLPAGAPAASSKPAKSRKLIQTPPPAAAIESGDGGGAECGGGGGAEEDGEGGAAPATITLPSPGIAGIAAFKTYAAARDDKVAAGEALNVEHVADVDLTASLVDWTDLDSDDKVANVTAGTAKKDRTKSRKRKWK